ncbi:CAP-Gly domain-containing linker protein 4-like isoform X2 [Arapaima gigas]
MASSEKQHSLHNVAELVQQDYEDCQQHQDTQAHKSQQDNAIGLIPPKEADLCTPPHLQNSPSQAVNSVQRDPIWKTRLQKAPGEDHRGALVLPPCRHRFPDSAGPEQDMTKEDVPQSSGGDPVLGRRWSTDPERPIVHQVASAPMPSDCEFSFFDPSEPQCRTILTDPQTTVPELFAVLRQWVPQVQRNISLIGNEILKRGCGVNDRDGLTDMTLLHYCCKAGAPGIGDAEAAENFARQLLSMGAEPGLRSRWTNMSALHYAAYFDVPQLIRVVLQALQPGEVDSTCSDFNFGTALHIAASNLCVSAVRCLLELGANPAFRNEKGQCPADVVPEPLDMPLEMADAAAQAKELRALLREALPQPCAPAPPHPPGLLSDKARAQLLSLGLRLGDRVVIAGQKVGTLRFCGSTDFAGGLWAGVELDEPEGKNDGSVAGVQYFTCAVRHGIFAPLSKIAKPPERRKHAPSRRSGPARAARPNPSHVTSKISTGASLVNSAPPEQEARPGCADGAADPPVAETGALSLSCSSSSSSLDSRHGPPSRSFLRQRPPVRLRRERPPADSKSTPPPPLTSAGPPRTRTPSVSSSMCDGPPVRLGERVLVVGQRTGVVRFHGKTSFAPGLWLGVELDKPSGKNDGSVGGVQYFSCAPKHGVFAPPSRVQRIHGSVDCLSELSSSRLNTSFSGIRRSLSTSSSLSTQKEHNRRSPDSRTRSMTPRRRWSTAGAGGVAGPSGASSAVRLQLGTQVLLSSANEMAVVRYVGTTDFAPGLWLGLELRSPKGKNDGTVGGRRYFSCRPGHGVLVRPSRVTYRGINGAKLVDELS